MASSQNYNTCTFSDSSPVIPSPDFDSSPVSDSSSKWRRVKEEISHSFFALLSVIHCVLQFSHVIFISYFLFCFIKVLLQILSLLWRSQKALLFYSDWFCLCLGTVEGVLESGMSSTTARSMTILQHIPFVVRFKDRVKVRRFHHYHRLSSR